MNFPTYHAIGAALAVAAFGTQCALAAELTQQQILESQRQARSVHLRYEMPPQAVSEMSVAMTVRESTPGSYFCALAFDGGYMGLQELPNRDRVAIFSVWDPGDPMDSHAREENVPDSDRTRVLYTGEGVRLNRFSREGTGAQAIMPLAWKENEKYTFTVSAEKDGERHVAFSAYCGKPGDSEKTKIATFSTHGTGGDAQLKNTYSFVEDFRRDFNSAQEVRRAEFTGVRVGDDSSSSEVMHAIFTGDRNPALSVDAGSVKNGFFLQTGGETRNIHSPIYSRIRIDD
ncbi:MAG: DUF3472 domain-containing protein [Kiritimatiellae bacterium]|nr:DUF3472 domain-containing protein [Kiritimatiellia bacterium]